jgi:hypothetical protein
MMIQSPSQKQIKLKQRFSFVNFEEVDVLYYTFVI